MPIRSLFGRRSGVPSAQQNDHARPGSSSSSLDVAHKGFEKVDTVGSRASLNIARRSQDTGEYKMSVVNDSGIYLPPSPVEKEVLWPKRYLSSRTSTDTRPDAKDIEPFSISRESFDSYRRSFDISARSPIAIPDPAPRQSLDSALFTRSHPRSTLAGRCRPPPPTAEEFEDVGLSDDGSGRPQPLQQQTKKRGFLSKFTTADSQDPPSAQQQQQSGQSSAMARFLAGRKRGQSGQGSELGAMPISSNPSKTSVSSVVEAQEAEAVNC